MDAPWPFPNPKSCNDYVESICYIDNWGSGAASRIGRMERRGWGGGGA